MKTYTKEELEDKSAEARANESAMHKTKRKDKTFYWVWDKDGLGGILKHICFVGGELWSSGDEFISAKEHDFTRQFDWALTPKQAKELYTKISQY